MTKEVRIKKKYNSIKRHLEMTVKFNSGDLMQICSMYLKRQVLT